MTRARFALLSILFLAGAHPASAQSLLAARGLGFLAEPLDARSRGLGGVALGLPDFTLSPVNPAGVAGIPAPALLVTVQSELFSAETAAEDVDASTVRFPLIRAAFPLGERWTLALGYGAFLDQTFATEVQDTLALSGETVPVTDRFESDGGVAEFQFGAAYGFSERLAVGASVEVYTGEVRDSISRVFPSSDLNRTTFDRSRSYSGVGFSAGARWLPSEAVSVGVTASVGGKLEAEAEDSLATSTSYDLPASAGIGASALVASGTTVALSALWTGWSSLDGALAETGGARDALAVAGGVEVELEGLGERVFPFRVGGRYATLPFGAGVGADGDSDVSERAVSAGAGAQLAGGAARLDLAAERGWRGDGADFDETFWRLTASLTLLGR